MIDADYLVYLLEKYSRDQQWESFGQKNLYTLRQVHEERASKEKKMWRVWYNRFINE
jgi:hypothetical protein